MKLTAIILASTIATAPPALEPQRYTLAWPGRWCKAEAAAWFNIPGLEQAPECGMRPAREKCGRAI